MKVSAYELRLLADRAWANGQKPLADKLHDIARNEEGIELPKNQLRLLDSGRAEWGSNGA